MSTVAVTISQGMSKENIVLKVLNKAKREYEDEGVGAL